MIKNLIILGVCLMAGSGAMHAQTYFFDNAFFDKNVRFKGDKVVVKNLDAGYLYVNTDGKLETRTAPTTSPNQTTNQFDKIFVNEIISANGNSIIVKTNGYFKVQKVDDASGVSETAEITRRDVRRAKRINKLNNQELQQTLAEIQELRAQVKEECRQIQEYKDTFVHQCFPDNE